jgi:hypothetical protein
MMMRRLVYRLRFRPGAGSVLYSPSLAMRRVLDEADIPGAVRRGMGKRVHLVPRGWRCSRPDPEHDGPCPLRPVGWMRVRVWWALRRVGA